MSKGFYGLRVTFLMGVFMALLRQPRAEGEPGCARPSRSGCFGLDEAAAWKFRYEHRG